MERFFRYLVASTAGAALGGFAGWHVFYALTRYPTENNDGDWAGLGALVIGCPAGALLGLILGIGLVTWRELRRKEGA